jgi:enoyl-CoA hydratase
MGLLSGKVQDDILFIEFRDQISRNSFSIRAAEELKALMDNYRNKCKAIIFTSQGRVFCSGGNLADYAAMTTADPGKEINRRITIILDEFERFPIPTICAVRGDCFGGGLEVVSAFDVVISAPHALFGFWQRKMGLSFGWGGGARLERRLGSHKLQMMALSGATIGGIEAQRIGLVDRVCIDPLIMEQAMSEARRLTDMPKAPVAALKSFTISNEQQTFEGLWWSDEHRMALQNRKLKGT